MLVTSTRVTDPEPRPRLKEAMKPAFHHFALTLMVNHACNLRCTYCYTGAKFSSPMPEMTGQAAIERALRSLAPHGRLDLGFFGGEPLLEAQRIMDWIAFARSRAATLGKRVGFNLTTNGTITGAPAWAVMMQDDLELAISFDGIPRLHDRHRRDTQGNGTSTQVEAAIGKLLKAGKALTVVMVVRPDNLEAIPEALEHLHGLGVRQAHLSLDLWTAWTAEDGRRLDEVVTRAAELWRGWLPDFSLNWFDGKTASLAGLSAAEETTQCGFGDGEVAVAPSGRLYPCERLIGEDRPDHPLRLPGHALEGADFLQPPGAAFEREAPCTRCLLASACDTFCRCSNFIRTGDTNRPDGLLCILNKATARATLEVLAREAPPPLAAKSRNQEKSYA